MLNSLFYWGRLDPPLCKCIQAKDWSKKRKAAGNLLHFPFLGPSHISTAKNHLAVTATSLFFMYANIILYSLLIFIASDNYRKQFKQSFHKHTFDLSFTLIVQLFHMVFQHPPLLSNAISQLFTRCVTRQFPHILFIYFSRVIFHIRQDLQEQTLQLKWLKHMVSSNPYGLELNSHE